MAHIDWLNMTFPYSDAYLEIIPDHPAFEIEDEIKGIPRYERSFRLACGGLFSVPSPDNARQKCLIELPGQACQGMRAKKCSDLTVLDMAIRKGGKFTRLDIAFDTDNPLSMAIQTKWSWDKGEKKTVFRSEPKVIEGPDGDTVYFGHETSPRRIRVYDKAKELKRLGDIMTRIELQSRKPFADIIARDALRESIALAGASHIKSLLDFPHLDWWGVALDGKMDTGQVGRKLDKDIMKWLRESVQPAIMRLKRTGSPRERLALIAWHDAIWPEYADREE